MRKVVFSKITGNKDREHDAKSLMLKAYLEFSAVSDTTKYDDDGKPIGPVTRSRWPDLVNDNAKNHNEKYNAMLQGNFYANIEKDPRDHTGPDDKIDLGGGGGGLDGDVNSATYNRQKSRMFD